MKFSDSDLSAFSKEQLEANLRELQKPDRDPPPPGDFQASLEELQVHRIELEMQNRALREMQSELEQSLQRYADLYDNLPLPYVTITPTGQITGANRAALEWLHTDRRGLTGAYLSKFLDPYDAGRFAAHLEMCLAFERPLTIELTFRPTQGQIVTVQLLSRVTICAQNGERQINVAISDVSRLKQVQRSLEESNREQEVLNHSISHDLRGPLVTISNYARIVLTEHGTSLDDESRGMIQRIESAAQRMQHTLKQMLEYNSVMCEEVVLHPVSLDELVRGVLAEHRAVVQERNAEISCAPGLPLVRASASLLSQVISKVLANALLYTKEGTPPRVRITCENNEKHVVLRIADEGIGIELRHHERIFAIFERLHGHSQYPGSGVGLAIARRAAERMNARIWVQSDVGRGSCFCVELPKA